MHDANLAGSEHKLRSAGHPTAVRTTLVCVISAAPSVLTSIDEPLFNALAHPTGDVLLAAPYITYPVASRIATAAVGSPVGWRVITRRDPVAVRNGVLNVPGLRSLLAVDVAVSWAPALHAKAYLVGDAFGIIGSGNLTAPGTGMANPNAELGVRLTPAQVVAARTAMLTWTLTDATWADLDLLEQEAQAYTKSSPPAHVTPADSVALNVDRLLSDARDPSRTLWVKAEHGQPDLSHWRSDSWFASPSPRKRPKIKPGDLAIIYAQQAHACYAVVEVTSDPIYDPTFLISQGSTPADAERWPWISHTHERLVPNTLVTVSREEIGVEPGGLQNGHSRMTLAGFTTGVRHLEQAAAAL